MCTSRQWTVPSETSGPCSIHEEMMMIRCYVVDSSETIKVTLSPNDEIDDLRRQIKDREVATFRNVDESSIKVWKVRLLYKFDCAPVTDSRSLEGWYSGLENSPHGWWFLAQQKYSYSTIQYALNPHSLYTRGLCNPAKPIRPVINGFSIETSAWWNLYRLEKRR